MNKKVLLEAVWWITTIVLVIMIMMPIYNNDPNSQYPFYASNIFFVALFITYTRYIFLLKHTFLAHQKILKVVFVFVSIPLFLYALDSFYDFMDVYDKDGFIKMVSHMEPDEAMSIVKYIRNEYTFFAVGGFIVLVLFPIRLIISVWRNMNRNSV